MPHPPTDRRRVRRCLAAVLALALVAAACTGGGDELVTPTPDERPGVDDDQEFVPPPPVEDAVTEPGVGDDYEWSTLSSGAGGFVTGLDSNADGSVRLARTDVGGVYRWDAAGERWDQLITADAVADSHPDDYQVEAMAIAPSDPDRLYLSVGNSRDEPDGRVLISSDGGASWVASGDRFVIQGNADWRTSGERLAVDPANPDIVLLGTRREGLWRSEDAGATFQPVDTVPVGTKPAGDENQSDAGVLFVVWAADGSQVVAGVSGVGVLRSTDGGRTFSTLVSHAGMAFDAEEGVDGRLWIVGRNPGAVWVVDGDDVRTVTPNDNREYETVTVDPFDPDRVLVGGRAIGNGDLFLTTNGGDDWDGLGIETTCPAIPWLEQYPNDFLPTGSLRFDRTTPDRVWVPEGFGVWVGIPTPDRLDLVCEADGIEELVSNDVIVPPGGRPVTAHWDRAIFWHGSEDAADAVVHPAGRFQSAWDLDWTPADPSFVVAVMGDQRGCCRGEPDSFLSAWSDDGGQNWTPFASYDAGHPTALLYGNIAISATDTDTLVWLPTFNGAPHISSDRGATWTEVRLPGTEDSINDNGVYTGGSHTQYFLNRKVLVADRIAADTFYLYHRDLGIFRSVDGGVTWELQPSEGLPTGWTVGYFNAQLVASPTVEGHLVFTPGLQDSGPVGLFESRDGGATWQSIPGMADVTSLGFGASLTADGPPAVYLQGTFSGQRGLWRSGDDLVSWDLLDAAPGGNYQGIKTITGSLDVPGEVYLGFTGTSFIVGRPAPTGGE